MKELKNPIVFRLETNIGEKDNIVTDYVFEKIAEDVVFFGYYENNIYKDLGKEVLKDIKDNLKEAIENLIGNGYKKLEDTKDLVYVKDLQVSTSSDKESDSKDDNIDNLDTIKGGGKKRENENTMEAQFRRVKKQEFLEFFAEGLGIITLTCKRINLNKASFYNWYKEDDKFKEAVDSIKCEQHSEVEDKLLNAITDGNIAAIIFYLKSKHPDYKQRLALEGELGLKGDYNRLSNEELEERIRKYISKPGSEKD